jgi:hypothetical protein
MKRSELKQIIREVVEEVMKDDFAPLGVADESRLDEKTPPNFPKKLHDKILNQYKGEEEKAYATMWKIFYEKEKGHKKVNEMWTAWETESVQEISKEQNAEHDETDMSNPEEKREVELAKQAKDAAEKILKMHGK